LWLERIGGTGGQWFVLDMPSAESARELVAVIHAFGVGAKGLDIEVEEVNQKGETK
jgi:hypothetical protein